MAKFPTYEEMGKKVAEKALDEFLYNGKSIREWMQIITSEDAVSRQAVEEMIKAEMPERGMWEIEGDKEKETVCEVCVDLMQKLSELSPVTTQPKTGHWIPVADKLPNFNDIVLASADSDYDELRVILTVYSGEEFWFNGKIKAWMPIPEPYKEEGRG